MNMIRVLIVDDEELARYRVRRMLSGDKEIEIIGECSSAPDALQFLGRNTADLVFLDIQMPEMDGFALLRQLDVANMPEIIFITAYDEYALRAFEVHALDYLLKPLQRKRFQEALQHAKDRLQNGNREGITQRTLSLLKNLEKREIRPLRIPVRTDGRILFIPVAEIEWVRAMDNYMELHVGKSTYTIRQTMTQLEKELDPTQFVRIHRSILVNVERIRELQPWFHGTHRVVLQNGATLNVGRKYQQALFQKLQL